MKSLAGVVKEATRLVRPSPAEERRLGALAEGLMRKTRRAAAAHPETAGVVLGGSYAKGTWLPNDVDIDIFVKFRTDTDEATFERVGLEVGAAATSGHPRGKKYAQHPYTEATVGGVKVNVVPCYDVEKGLWRSAADRSPFHVVLVEVLPEAKKTEVRLLKKFMRGVGVYGAEIQNQGFSGYVAEVLVMNHGGLEGVLGHFANFRPAPDSFTMALPDPVDERRDLGRAVSGEKLGRMILASREFLSRPSLAFFRGMKGKARPDLKGEVVALAFSHPPLSEDTLWGELKKTLHQVEARADRAGFKVARVLAASDNLKSSALLFLPEFDVLPRLEQRVGPTVDRRDETEQFLSKNRRRTKLAWVGPDGRTRILQARAHTEFVAFLKDEVVGGLEDLGASREMERGIARSGRLLTGRTLLQAARSKKWLGEGLTEIVSDSLGTG
jgi:tRNA nucleotidyltransferase (CCA-adding enzyme)